MVDAADVHTRPWGVICAWSALIHTLQKVCLLDEASPVPPQGLGQILSGSGGTDGSLDGSVTSRKINRLFVQRDLWHHSLWVRHLLFP